MNLIESFKSALQNVRSNKMRSFLTMLGIIIGISSVITIVSIGQGGKTAITGEFQNIGTNIINVRVKSVNGSIEQRDYFTFSDSDLLKSKIPEITDIILAAGDMGNIKTEKKTKMGSITAVSAAYPKFTNLEMTDGRFLNERDEQSNKNVVVIDDITAQKLFGNANPLGQRVQLSVRGNTLSFMVVGICANSAGSMAAMFGDNLPGTALIPITVADKILPEPNISQLVVNLSDMTHSKEIASKIVRLLEKNHRNVDKYTAEEGFKELDMINNVLNIFTMVIGAIAGISLLVGGIGVMNIMLVSVTERTREIGIRKALGAKDRDIMLQFLTESLILCLIGGIIGMSLGIGMGYIVGKLINVPLGVSPLVILLAFSFSSAVGIFFGLYPASKAAKLDPIEALRYE